MIDEKNKYIFTYSNFDNIINIWDSNNGMKISTLNDHLGNIKQL
jgi:hypothetical protein